MKLAEQLFHFEPVSLLFTRFGLVLTRRSDCVNKPNLGIRELSQELYLWYESGSESQVTAERQVAAVETNLKHCICWLKHFTCRLVAFKHQQTDVSCISVV